MRRILVITKIRIVTAAAVLLMVGAGFLIANAVNPLPARAQGAMYTASSVQSGLLLNKGQSFTMTAVCPSTYQVTGGWDPLESHCDWESEPSANP